MFEVHFRHLAAMGPTSDPPADTGRGHGDQRGRTRPAELSRNDGCGLIRPYATTRTVRRLMSRGLIANRPIRRPAGRGAWPVRGAGAWSRGVAGRGWSEDRRFHVPDRGAGRGKERREQTELAAGPPTVR